MRVRNLYEHQKRLSQIAARMYRNGILIDQEERRRLSDVLLKEHQRARDRLLALVRIKGFRCTPNDLRALIYRRHETAKVKRFSLPDPLNPRMWKSETRISVGEPSLRWLMTDSDTPPALIPIIETYWE